MLPTPETEEPKPTRKGKEKEVRVEPVKPRSPPREKHKVREQPRGRARIPAAHGLDDCRTVSEKPREPPHVPAVHGLDDCRTVSERPHEPHRLQGLEGCRTVSDMPRQQEAPRGTEERRPVTEKARHEEMVRREERPRQEERTHQEERPHQEERLRQEENPRQEERPRQHKKVRQQDAPHVVGRTREHDCEWKKRYITLKNEVDSQSQTDELGLEGLTIVLHMQGRDDLVINTDLRNLE